ncbi:hypothetical protein TCAL_15818 [Tigriopus californicus]|uniref:Uncharacterized protein n=1 Tax=Tigriopus californicus TaxID=6832 RepID=A0A553NQL5_TIGCA|nr:hypothetical protein TCAL_15818 [Tigriopus californicus]
MTKNGDPNAISVIVPGIKVHMIEYERHSPTFVVHIVDLRVLFRRHSGHILRTTASFAPPESQGVSLIVIGRLIFHLVSVIAHISTHKFKLRVIHGILGDTD